MSRSLAAALCALATLASGCLPFHPGATGSGGAPDLHVSVDEEFYRIAGASAPELNRELARRGPEAGGVRWQGMTEFRLAYSYRPAAGPTGCRAARPRVSVRVVTTLPRWSDRGDAPAALRSDWDLYLSRLRAHEDQHRRIAIEGGRELLADFGALDAPDCEALRRTALERVEARRARVRQEEAAWDLASGHGLGGS